MSFCLPNFAADLFKSKLDKGEVSADKLASAKDSAARREMLSFLGEANAKKVNALFEATLLLKNQKTAFKKMAEQLLGDKPEALRDTLSKIDRMTEAMSKMEKEQFLEDLIEQRLGFAVTAEEIGMLTDVARRVTTSKQKYVEMVAKDKTYTERVRNGKEISAERDIRLKYGVDIALYKELVGSLKPESKMTLKKFLQEPLTNTAGLYKAVRASWDAGFSMNQSVINLYDIRSLPIFARGVSQSVKAFLRGVMNNRDLANEMSKIKTQAEFRVFLEKITPENLGGLPPDFAIKADAFSRPDALNGNFERMKVALGLHTEEAIPTNFPEQMPGLGRLFRGSNQAYMATALQTRVALAEKLIQRVEKNNANIKDPSKRVDITDVAEAEAIGNVVNSMTGRGSLGTGEAMSKRLNVFLFSARLLTGTFHTLTAHMLNPKVKFDSFAQKEAIKTLGIATATFVTLTSIYEALNPGSTDLDPRSAHFGQWKIGERWYNVIGPYRPMVRVMAQIIPTTHNGVLGFHSKGPGGKWRTIRFYPKKKPEFGTYTPLDVAEDFFEGKGSPAIARIIAHWKGTEFGGDKVTPESDLLSLSPIQIESLMKNMDDPKVDSLFLESLASFFNVQGISYKK